MVLVGRRTKQFQMHDSRFKKVHFPGYCVGHIEVGKVQTELKNSVLPILQNCHLDRASCKPEVHITSFFLCPTAYAMTDFQKYH